MSGQPAGRKRCVAVVYGGRSSEHSISCVTAGGVLAAIDPDQYDVVAIGITHDGRWVLQSGEPAQLQIVDGRLPSVDESREPVALAGGQLVVQEPGGVAALLGQVDVVFPVLHGPWGEDGTIQGLLELADIPYVGSGVLASAAAMDKHFMKLLFQAQGLPVLPYAVITARDWARDKAACFETVDSLRYPVFVKPCRAGSSSGISKVRSRDELLAAVEAAHEFDPKVIVEASAGEGAREIECGVLGGFGADDPHASVVAEIHVGDGHEFYDFEAKYLSASATDVPADLPAHIADKVQRLSVRAFDALGCEGLARVDFFVLRDDKVVLNEINTMPGFTSTSMFPRMWAESGLSYSALIDRLIQLALDRPVGLR